MMRLLFDLLKYSVVGFFRGYHDYYETQFLLKRVNETLAKLEREEQDD